MVQLYVASIANLPEPDACSALVSLLSKERQQKWKALLQSDKKKQCLGAGLLLNKVLSYYHVSAEDVGVGKNGKPEVDGICFNLSHSGELVVCAVSETQVGCDIEQRKAVPLYLAERFFGTREKEYLSAFTGAEYDRQFFRLWTMKESYVKMTGEGMSLFLDAFEIIPGDEIRVFCDGQIQDCYLKEYEVSGYQITVCAKEEAFAEIQWETI